MTVKEFWNKLQMKDSSHSNETVLYFNGNFVSSGSAMGMKMEGDELLKRMIERGEVII